MSASNTVAGEESRLGVNSLAMHIALGVSDRDGRVLENAIGEGFALGIDARMGTVLSFTSDRLKQHIGITPKGQIVNARFFADVEFHRHIRICRGD